MLPNGNRNSKLFDDDISGLQERLEKGLLTGSSGESDSSTHDSGESELDLDKQNLWVVFQTAASSIAQLYRESFQWDAEAAWTPFQAAALAVTNLYKESLLLSAKAYEVGKRNGQNKVTRDLLQHLRHSPKKVRRDEVLSVLSARQRIRSSPSASPLSVMASSSAQPTLAQTLEQEQLDLALFKDAVVSKGLPNDSDMSLLGALPSSAMSRKRASSIAFPPAAAGTSPNRSGGSSSPQFVNSVATPMTGVDCQLLDSASQRKRQKPQHNH